MMSPSLNVCYGQVAQEIPAGYVPCYLAGSFSYKNLRFNSCLPGAKSENNGVDHKQCLCRPTVMWDKWNRRAAAWKTICLKNHTADPISKLTDKQTGEAMGWTAACRVHLSPGQSNCLAIEFQTLLRSSGGRGVPDSDGPSLLKTERKTRIGKGLCAGFKDPGIQRGSIRETLSLAKNRLHCDPCKHWGVNWEIKIMGRISFSNFQW